MNKILLSVAVLILITSSFALGQNPDPVKWAYTVKQANKNEATLVFTAKIEKKWHLYSQHINGTEGPIPTSFNFEKSSDYEIIGMAEEEKGEEYFDNNFNMKLTTFSGEVTFKQKVKLNSHKKFSVKGIITHMACDDKQCLPPKDVDFMFELNTGK